MQFTGPRFSAALLAAMLATEADALHAYAYFSYVGIEFCNENVSACNDFPIGTSISTDFVLETDYDVALPHVVSFAFFQQDDLLFVGFDNDVVFEDFTVVTYSDQSEITGGTLTIETNALFGGALSTLVYDFDTWDLDIFREGVLAVSTRPVPLPAGVWLLATGLVSLRAFRGRPGAT